MRNRSGASHAVLAAIVVLLSGCTEPADRPDIGSPPECSEPERVCPDSSTPVCRDTGWWCHTDTITVCDTSFRDDTTVVREILDLNGLETVSAKGIPGWRFDTLVLRVILDQNSMRTIPVGALVGMDERDDCWRITDLDLSANALHSLGGHALSEVPEYIGLLVYLERLWLFNGTFDTLPGSMGNLVRLKELKVQECELRYLPDEICLLDSLTTLYAVGNHLRALPDSIGRLDRLSVLEISDNELDSLPLSLTDAEGLNGSRRLNIAHNYLCSVPEQLAEWLDSACLEGPNWPAGQYNCATLAADTAVVRALLDSVGADTLGVGSVASVRAGRVARLDLSAWGLTAVPPQVFELDSLEQLALDSNTIDTLPGAIDSLSVLRELSLAANMLEPASTASLERLRRLRVLVLARNRFAAPPLGLSLMDSLRTLDLSGNGLDSLPSVDRLRLLERLCVYDNALRVFPALDSLVSLRVLDAAQCSLATVHPGIGRLTHLDSINLSGNQLTNLPLEVAWLTGGVRVNVAGNQLCSLSVAVENWLDLHAGPTWKADQDCP